MIPLLTWQFQARVRQNKSNRMLWLRHHLSSNTIPRLILLHTLMFHLNSSYPQHTRFHMQLTFQWVRILEHPFCILLLSVCRIWHLQACQDRDYFLYSVERDSHRSEMLQGIIRHTRSHRKWCIPREKISHSKMPYDQTSLSNVYTHSKILSGDIHFTGRRACKDINRTLSDGQTLKQSNNLGNIAKAWILGRNKFCWIKLNVLLYYTL